MSTNRRNFLATGITSLCAAGAAKQLSAAEKPSASVDPGSIQCLDYGLSFLCNPSPHNAVRFWIESRTTIFDDAAGKQTTYYQCASCKSEDTFAKKNLFYGDNYDFMPIFDMEHLLIFRRPAHLSDRYRSVMKVEDMWGKPILKLRAGKPVEALETWERIRDTTAEGIPLVSQTEIHNAETGLRAVIECPIKTMNISLERNMYQVDTGPIALPDLTKRYDLEIECFSLAFVAFNAPDFASFVVEQVTPVIEKGEEKCKIYHYSDPFNLPTKNRLYAVGSVS